MRSATLLCLLLTLAASLSAQTTPVPFVNQPLVPMSVAPGGGDFTLTVPGTGFVSGAAVNWNATPLATTFVSGSKLTATVPSSSIATPGTASITVTNPGSITSNVQFLNVTQARTALGFSVFLQDLSTSGTTPASVTPPVLADFNNDGKQDLAFIAVGSTDFLLCIELGNGDTTFQVPNCVDTGVPMSVPDTYGWIPWAAPMIAGDFNGDGKLDLVVSNVFGNSNVTASIFLGNGDGTVQAATTFSAGANGAYWMAAGDFNGDGKLDLAAIDSVLPSDLSIVLGNGDGTFQSPNTQQINFDNGQSLAVGDFNNDGKLDLAIGCGVFEDYCSLLLALGNGDGTFQTTQSTVLGPQVVTAAADINGDGNLDLAFYNSLYNEHIAPASQIDYLFGDGNGSFGTGAVYGINWPSQENGGPLVADINGDGIPDLALAEAGDGLVDMLLAVIYGSGSGQFQPESDYSSSNGLLGSTWLALADFNGDGRVDAVEAIATSNNPSVPPSITFEFYIQGDFPAASLSPATLSFPSQPIGISDAPQTVTLTNTGLATLDISSISLAGTNPSDFALTNTCGPALAANASCQISVTFTPQALGTRSGTLTISDNTANTPQVVTLTGTGQDFSIGPSGSSSATVAAGQTANYAISVAPVGGFDQTVSLSCSGAPASSICSFSPSSVTLNGVPVLVAVAVSTAGSSARLTHPASPSNFRKEALWLPLWGLSALLLMGIWKGSSRTRTRPVVFVFALLCLISLGGTLSACGGNGSTGGTAPGTYNLTVTGSFTSGSNSLTHATTLQLVVQ